MNKFFINKCDTEGKEERKRRKERGGEEREEERRGEEGKREEERSMLGSRIPTDVPGTRRSKIGRTTLAK